MKTHELLDVGPVKGVPRAFKARFVCGCACVLIVRDTRDYPANPNHKARDGRSYYVFAPARCEGHQGFISAADWRRVADGGALAEASEIPERSAPYQRAREAMAQAVDDAIADGHPVFNRADPDPTGPLKGGPACPSQ